MVKLSPVVMLVMVLFENVLESVIFMLMFTCCTLLTGEKPELEASVEGAFRVDLTTISLFFYFSILLTPIM